MTLHRYWTSACPDCPIKAQCTTGDYRRITRWEHEAVLEAMQRGWIGRPERCDYDGRPSSTCSARSRPGWARRTS